MKKRFFSLALPLSALIMLALPAYSMPEKDEWDDMLLQLSETMPEIFDTDSAKKKEKKDILTDAEKAEAAKEEAERSIKIKERIEKKKRKKLTKKLYKAVRVGDIEVVKSMVLQHADTNYSKEEGVTLLHIASAKGYFHIARILVSHGADVDAQTSKSWTPLHHAARFGHMNIVRYLMSKGANMHLANTDGKNPYALSLQLKHEEISKFFRIWQKYH